jgi:glucans biosynthesis protein
MRRTSCLIIALIAFIALSIRTFARTESAEITLDYVAKKAEERARKPFRSPKHDLPEVLRADKLDYDKYREIRFRRDQALWSAEKLPFAVEFFHPGYLYQEPVRINEFSMNYVQPVRFVQDFFDYGKLRIKNQIPVNTGYAGFRVLYPLNQPDRLDELGAFLGASYFRLLGKGQHYGQSARGLAIDCGEADRPEEFPIFTDWWLGKPLPDNKSLHLFAILDSVSCAGAYEFLIHPGETTTAEIEAVIYLREDAKIHAVAQEKKSLLTLGMAPLTSMFWFGENSEQKFDDYRPEVHDSDGLLMRMENKETLWRPLDNTSAMRHQKFAAKNIRGFGLLQRDREFSSYQDIFNLYHLVPSVWVEPRGLWGEGDLHLVELSTRYEGLDNIVAFWEPKEKPQPLQPFRFGYTLHWTRETDMKLSPNKVISTRIGADPANPDCRQIAIDFTGPKLAALPDGTIPQAIANCSDNGTIVESQVFQIPFNSSWRAMLKMKSKPGNKDPIDLRCTLKKGEEVLTETWTYHWSPP